MRARSAFYGRCRDDAMQRLYVQKAYRLFVELDKRRLTGD